LQNKCESCRHFEPSPKSFWAGRCVRVEILNDASMRGYAVFNIKRARNICDREGDGIFVYFEPRDPATGAAFKAETRPVGSVSQTDCSCFVGSCRGAEGLSPKYRCVVQITRNHPEQTLAMAATGGAR